MEVLDTEIDVAFVSSFLRTVDSHLTTSSKALAPLENRSMNAVCISIKVHIGDLTNPSLRQISPFRRPCPHGVALARIVAAAICSTMGMNGRRYRS